LLKKIDVNVALQPLDVTANRGNEVSGDYLMSSLGSVMDFDDPIDPFGQWYVTKGGRWYQKSSIPELDALYQSKVLSLISRSGGNWFGKWIKSPRTTPLGWFFTGGSMNMSNGILSKDLLQPTAFSLPTAG
jgi:hypothetical protein